MKKIDGLKIYEAGIDKSIARILEFNKGAWMPRQVFSTFDIETTTYLKGVVDGQEIYENFMYVWQWCIGDWSDDKMIITGRTWPDYIQFLKDTAHIFNLDSEHTMPVYVHNLAYEFQYLRSIVKVRDMFATEKRVPLKFVGANAFEFRCSYKLTNMSLARYCQAENVTHGKKQGFDYRKKRYPDTPLTDAELSYCVDDVLGLHEAISHDLEKQANTLKTVPMTSTGYVRREARGAMNKNKKNHYLVTDKTALDAHLYYLCNDAKRGGNTHANRYNAARIIEDVTSYDISSSYPFQMVAKKFPMGKFTPSESLDDFDTHAHLIKLRFNNLQCRARASVPYIAADKCHLLGSRLQDNGRILQSDVCTMTITEIDYEIIMQQYVFDGMEVIENWSCKKEYLPKEYRDYIFNSYREKCELKFGDSYFYGKKKNKVNATYGMMLTALVHDKITYSEKTGWDEITESVEIGLNDYYNSFGSFLAYQWGLWVTSHARADLQEAIDSVGAIDFIYCDTDSVKFIGNHEKFFEEANKRKIKQLEEAGYGVVETHGEKFVLGVFEKDATYKEFITLGAKKYAYRYADGKLGITVAGLNKKQGAEYLEKNGGLKAFKPGTIFGVDFSGRTVSHYNDDTRYYVYEVDGHNVEHTSNIAIVDTTYQLGITDEYAALLDMSEIDFEGQLPKNA